jgi:hypothetical protein
LSPQSSAEIGHKFACSISKARTMISMSVLQDNITEAEQMARSSY